MKKILLRHRITITRAQTSMTAPMIRAVVSPATSRTTPKMLKRVMLTKRWNFRSQSTVESLSLGWASARECPPSRRSLQLGQEGLSLGGFARAVDDHDVSTGDLLIARKQQEADPYVASVACGQDPRR